jgi:hypothetical protein
MYEFLLISHSWLRWAVLGFGLYALYTYYTGWQAQRKYTASDKRIGSFFIGSLHLQLVIGLLLYFVYSPVVQMAMANMKVAMKDRELRFYAMEHLTMMIIGIVIAQIGSIKARKKPSDTSKFKTAFIWFAVALFIILLMIPWGIWNSNRPMFRM